MGVNVPIFQVAFSQKIFLPSIYFFTCDKRRYDTLFLHCSQLQKRYEVTNMVQNGKLTEPQNHGHRLI